MARPTGCFLILSQARIEALVEKAYENLASGRVLMSYSDSGTSVSKDWPMSVEQVMVECRYALQIKDPQQYGGIDRVRVYNGLWNFRGL
jgi:hypothetical protein